MNKIDLLALVFGALAVVGGWVTGFVRRISSWLGLIGGLAIASWILPQVVTATNPQSSSGQFVIGAVVLVAGGMVGHVAGATLGARLHRLLATAHLGTADRAFGAIAGVAGLVVALWVILPTMADVPGWPSENARTSTVAGWIHDSLGRPPASFSGLSKSLGLNGLPKVFDQIDPSPTAKPPPDSPLDPAVLEAAEQSVVKVAGPACGRIQSGSGVVVAPGLIITNAHVVAGTTSSTVETTDGARSAGRVVAFDPDLDLALVRAPSLDRPPMTISDAQPSDVGDVLGFPGGGGLVVSSYRISERTEAAGRDIYDSAPVKRTIFVMGSSLAPGDSGGPLISPAGEVVGLAFAIAPDRPGVAYAIVGRDVRAMAGRTGLEAPVSTGDCAG